MQKWLQRVLLSFMAFVLPVSSAFAAWQMDFQTPVTSIAKQQYHLHFVTMMIIIVVFFVVFGLLFWVLFAYRKGKNPSPSRFKHNTLLEVIWTGIPFVIVIGIAFSATKTVVDMRDTSNSDITIKVTGYQWEWGYDYLSGNGAGISYISTLSTPYSEFLNNKPQSPNYLLEVDHPLVVPVNKRIRILTTSADVIHAWYVPSLGIKQDAIPGLIRDAWFKADKIGIYRGDCAVLCGRNHAFMPIVVQVVSAEDYAKWVKDQLAIASPKEDLSKKYTKEELMQKGKEVYQTCAACHQANGKGGGPFPALDGSAVANGPISHHITQVLHGKNAMPAFAAVLSDTEIAAVVTYERNAWSNHTGDLVQPSDVHALRIKG